MSDISVVIGTFGDPEWPRLAAQRALVSVSRQVTRPASVHQVHANSLADARNRGADEAAGEWLCFLDADDELDPMYLEAMQAAIETHAVEGNWLLQPATLGVVDGREDPAPVVIPPKPLVDGNFMVIGTLIRREQFQRVGGFRDWPCYEDWELWLRAWTDGAALLAVPEAIYRVHVSPGSRNNGTRALQVSTYNAIRKMHQHAARRRAAGSCRLK